MKFSDFSICVRCLLKQGNSDGCVVRMGIGDTRGWSSDGAVYCVPCLKLRDIELRKIAQQEEEERKKKK